MAGTIICDYIRTDANRLSLNVGNTTFATINAGGFYGSTGNQLIAANGAISADSITTGALNASLITTGALNASLATTGTLPKGRLPSGSVLQVVASSYATGTTTTSGTRTITTTFSNSTQPITLAGAVWN